MKDAEDKRLVYFSSEKFIVWPAGILIVRLEEVLSIISGYIDELGRVTELLKVPPLRLNFTATIFLLKYTGMAVVPAPSIACWVKLSSVQLFTSILAVANFALISSSLTFVRLPVVPVNVSACGPLLFPS